MSGRLKLIFSPGEGYEDRIMCIDLDDYVVRRIQDIAPPMKHGLPFVDGEVSLTPFNQVIETFEDRRFRKDLFMHECQRLGALMAERMEDAEGWHDSSRIEPARIQLKTGKPPQ